MSLDPNTLSPSELVHYATIERPSDPWVVLLAERIDELLRKQADWNHERADLNNEIDRLEADLKTADDRIGELRDAIEELQEEQALAS